MMKPVCSFGNSIFKSFKSSYRNALVVLVLALACAPLARAAGVVSSCDEPGLLAALNGGGLVTFSCSGTITLTATITISSDTTIDGTGETVVISGGNAVQVLVVPTGVKVNLHKLTILNGYSGNGGGGINNSGTMTVTNSTFSGNSASFGYGGAIGNSGTLTVTNSTFSGNSGYIAGGIGNLGTLTVTNSTFSGNTATAGVGGGIGSDYSGTATVINSSISGNSALGSGGGGIASAGYAGTLTVIDSTISGNSAYFGGGIYNGGTAIVTNDTISGNSSTLGGGIDNIQTATITNSTVSGNSSSTLGGGISNVGTLTLQNTIVANSPSGGDCLSIIFRGSSLIDGGGNLITDNTCGTIPASPDPLLGPLQYNGGRTQTMALGTGSPAIYNAVEANCPIRDQRGFPRPFASQLAIILGHPATCSIGAYEPGTLFKSFLAEAAVNLTNPVSPSFVVVGTFSLRADSDGAINPLTDLVQFRLGTIFSTTISPNSFQLIYGSYVYVRLVNGFPVFRMTIFPLGGNNYAFAASSGQPWNLALTQTIVQLSIGDDGGTTLAGSPEAEPENPPAPRLTSIAPNSGNQGSSVPVTLTGTALTGATAVHINDPNITVSGITVVNDTTVTTTFTIAPVTVAGAKTVSVSTPGGTSNALPFTVVIPPPLTLTSISPTSGAQGIAFPQTVTITGTGLIAATAVNITGGGVTVSNIVVVDPNTVTATFTISPTATLGARNVTVTGPGGTSNAVTFTVVPPPPPTLTSISPSSVLRGTSTIVMITGTSFTVGSTVIVSPAVAGFTVSGVTAFTATSIVATLTSSLAAPIGSVNIGVVTAGGASNTLPFAVTGPVLTSITPTSARGAVGIPDAIPVPVSLFGSGLIGTTAVNISGGGVTVSGFSVVNDTQVNATFTIAAGAALGARNVTVTAPGGTSNAVTFTTVQ
jgi:hypothetical protein